LAHQKIIQIDRFVLDNSKF